MPENNPNYNVIFSSASDDWPTPLDFYQRLDAEFGFVLDVCSSTTNHKARAYYAMDHADESRRDGLAQDWAAEARTLDGSVWMNPPYGDGIGEWMSKAHAAAQAGATVVCLVPVRSATHWWHDHVLSSGAEVRYVRGRLTFGEYKSAAAFASAVVIYRPTDQLGVPGPVSVMTAKWRDDSPSAHQVRLANMRQMRRDKRPLAVEQTITEYEPTRLGGMAWTRAAKQVKSLVLVSNPRSVSLARARLGALVGLLDTQWDGKGPLDLSEFLTEERVAVHLATLSSVARVAAVGSHLRMLRTAQDTRATIRAAV